MGLKKRLLKNSRLYLIVNVNPAQRPSVAKIEGLIKSGVDIVQLRCKGLPDKAFLDYALLLRRLCKRHKVTFIINDRPDIAKVADADGLHIGQDDIPPSSARRIIGTKRLLGFSTHSIREVEKAAKLKVIDYIGIGPIFKTGAKQDMKPIGLEPLRYASTQKNLVPFYAIGGINPVNINEVVAAGAKRIAVSGAVFNSDNPKGVVRELRKVLYDTL